MKNMKKLLSKTKSALQELQDSASSSKEQPVLQALPSTIGLPTATDLFRYRYHHGTNLGSVFVLERWLSGSMFPSGSPAGGGAELDAVTSHLKTHGLSATRARWEDHWSNAVSGPDLEWLAREARCTSIRLPIGYFTLGPEWCRGTPFEDASAVYVNAWAAVGKFTARARSWGIGTLLDFHAVQGGANGEEHSGTTSGKADLWESRRDRDAARKALRFIAEQVSCGALEGVVGIQVVNEAMHHAKGMYEWYEEVIREIGSVDESIPVYISDAWDLETCLRWVNGRHVFDTKPRNPVVVDTHKYYTFSDGDRSQTPQQIINRIPGEFQELNGKEGALADRGEAQLIVGEWSCVLDGQTWSRVQPQERDGLVKAFGLAQSQKWQEKAGGAYFWTYKMEWMPGGEWGFEEQTRKSNILPPYSLTLPSQAILDRVQHTHTQRGQLATASRASHEEYWNRTAPGKTFEHRLYSEGWEIGFSDALNFFKMRAEGSLGQRAQEIVGGGDKIGCLEIWCKKRLLESGVRGEFLWEWEHGFRNGVSSFYGCVGV